MAYNSETLLNNAVADAEHGRKLLVKSIIGFTIMALEHTEYGTVKKSSLQLKKYRGQISQKIIDSGKAKSTAYDRVKDGFDLANKMLERLAPELELRHKLDEKQIVQGLFQVCALRGVENRASLIRFIKTGEAEKIDQVSPAEQAAQDLADLKDHGFKNDLDGKASDPDMVVNMDIATQSEPVAETSPADSLADYIANLSDDALESAGELILAEITKRAKAVQVAETKAA